MDNLAASAVWGLLIGATLVGGALVASATRLPERVAATDTALGGGVLLAAVALELIPEADSQVGATGTALGLLAGMLIYVGADSWLTRDEVTKAARRSGHAAAAGRSMALHPKHAQATRGESIAAGMVIDGVPESIALGLTIAEGNLGTALLAGILIGNFVEAYGAAQPIVAGGHSARFALTLMAVDRAIALPRHGAWGDTAVWSKLVRHRDDPGCRGRSGARSHGGLDRSLRL